MRIPYFRFFCVDSTLDLAGGLGVWVFTLGYYLLPLLDLDCGVLLSSLDRSGFLAYIFSWIGTEYKAYTIFVWFYFIVHVVQSVVSFCHNNHKGSQSL